MEEQAKAFVDSRLAHEIQQTNPVEQIRRPTDRLFIFVFPLLMLAWLVIGILALCAHQIDDKDAESLAQFKLYMNAPFSSFRFMHIVVFVISLISSTGFTLLGVFLNKKCTKFFVCLGIGLYILSTISVCSHFLFANVTDGNNIEKFKSNYKHSPSLDAVFTYINSVGRTWILVKAIFMIASVVSFFKVDQDDICSIVKDFCRIILASPAMIFFVGFITIWGCLVFLFTANAVMSDITSDRGPYHIFFDILILVIGCIFALSFIYNFALMIISQYAVNYYWKKGDKPAVGQSVSQIIKNHMGTVIFSCIPYVPFICAIVQAVKHTRSPRNKENFFFYIASKIFLVVNAEYFALIVSSMYATGYIKSLKKTFGIVLRRCLFYLAASGIIESIIGIIAFIVMTLAGIAFAITLTISTQETQRQDSKELELDFFMNIASFFYGFLISFVAFAILMYFSAKALLINKIIILNREEQYNEGKTEILNRL